MSVSHHDLPAPWEELRVRTRRFIRDVVIPAEPLPGERLDASERRRLTALAADAGVLAPHAPVEFGGQGVPIRHWSPIFQEAGYSLIGPAVLNCMAPDEGNMHMLEILASEDQKERYLRPLVAGEIRSCFAMTEPHPGAGSDPDALSTLADRVPGGWRITGEKRFISGAAGAAFAIVMARTGPDRDATIFFVSADNPGMRIGAQIHAIDRAIDGGHPHLHFEDCFVPDSDVLGSVGAGFEHVQVRLAPARLTHCMRWLGLARRSLDIALDRAERRQIFGARLRDLGLAQDLIAQCVIDVETADAMISRASAAVASDARAGNALSSVTKVYCSEAIFRVIDRSMQICGGDGVTDGLPLASYLNEVRPFRIYDGSTETHKWAIARRASSARRREIAEGEPDRGAAYVRDSDVR